MKGKRSYLIFAIGVLATVACAWLPIDGPIVQGHTTDKVVRDLLSKVTDTTPAGTPAKLVVKSGQGSATQPLVQRVSHLVWSKQKKTSEGLRPQFVNEGNATKTLLVSVETKPNVILATVNWRGQVKSKTQRLGNWLSLIPPLVALIIALAFRRVVLALFLAVFSGGIIMNAGVFTNAWIELKSLFGALVSFVGISGPSVDGYLGAVIADSFNLQILGFTLALVGLVAVVNRMGGTRGLVNALSRFARGPRSAQVVTSAMGTAIFFDDYANTVVVGTTARSLTDKHKVSREKLAYIVDSTSAPVAGIAIISTWIGYEVGLFDDLLGTVSNVAGMPGSGYELFFEILPLRFYCFFALALVILNAWTGRDMGPMYLAEKRARSGGPLVPPSDNGKPLEPGPLEKTGIPHLAINAIVPIGSVLVTILGCIIYIGTQGGSIDLGTLSGWQKTFEAAADHIQTILIGAALVGSLVAILLAVVQRLLSMKEALAAYFTGMRTLAEAAAILILAWAIKNVCDDLGTGMALVALVGDSVPAMTLPFVVFLLAGVVAFSTGSSWATMALVLPIAAPLAANLSGDALVVFACFAAVLDGAIWGDHCSPISDTTILSSTACGCPHLAHVKTQLPYAMLAMVAAGLIGYLGVTAGVPLGLSYLLGLGVMLAGLFLFGRTVGPSSEH